MNNVFLYGRLGKDPELRESSTGVAICNFSLATTSMRGRGENRTEKTQWHNVVCFARVAEAVGQNLTKGRACSVVGEIDYDSYEKDGQTRYITKILARLVNFEPGRSEAKPEGGGGGGAIDDDIPFAP